MYRLIKEAFDAHYMEELEEAILQSPYLGPSPLGAEFVDTLGFSLVFTRASWVDVIDEFPSFRRFMEGVIQPASNAFFMNPLVMRRGSEVGVHVDCRLLADRNVRVIPTLVSILYVRVPDGAGSGAITLSPGTDDAVRIDPTTNSVLHFTGRTLHSVDPVSTDGLRVNLVCEQHNLSDELLEGFPLFDVMTAGRASVPRATVG